MRRSLTKKKRTVVLRAVCGQSSSLLAAAAASTLDFSTREIDTHNAWSQTSGSTHYYYAPVSGHYEVNVMSTAVSATWAVNEQYYIQLVKNGTAAQIFARDLAEDTTAFIMCAAGSTLVKCAAGDTLRIIGVNTSGAPKSTTTASNENWIEIKKID